MPMQFRQCRLPIGLGGNIVLHIEGGTHGGNRAGEFRQDGIAGFGKQPTAPFLRAHLQQVAHGHEIAQGGGFLDPRAQ